jgi:hypothetical protein
MVESAMSGARLRGNPGALDAALAYSARGWPVFPVLLIRRNGKLDKQPLIKDWGNAASRDLTQIEKWWRWRPDAVIGIPTGRHSGIIVLDIDIKDGRNGFDTLADLGKPILPVTPLAHTASGGVHAYFADRSDIEIRNSSGGKGVGVGLDIRGTGGFVVTPPVSGYTWDQHYHIGNTPLRLAPTWLGYKPPKAPSAYAAMATGHHRLDPKTILAEACRRIGTAPPGSRHDTYRHETFKIATMVRDGLLSESEARHALEPDIMALGMRADGDVRRVEKYYNLAFDDGLRAPSGRARR